MLRAENFKIEYQASENSVPVNTELKDKLIAMAKACENGEIPEEASAVDIRITEIPENKEKRNIRHIIIKTAALAACLAVCVFSIPKVTDIYFNRTEDQEPDPGIIATETPAVNSGETKEEDDPDNTAQEGIEKGTERINDNAKGGERVNNIKADSRESEKAVTKNAGNAAAAVHRENAANPAASASQDGNAAAGAAAAQSMPEQSGEERVNAPEDRAAVNPPEIIKSAEEPEEILTSRDEFNKRLTLLDRQRAKLDAWDEELKPYAGRDETLDRSYADFTGDKDTYNKAADAYTARYGAADAEETLQNGIAEYDSTLGDDSSLFNECRESYRKSANYIEMSGMNEEPAETGAETVQEPTEPAETEGTVNEESAIEN